MGPYVLGWARMQLWMPESGLTWNGKRMIFWGGMNEYSEGRPPRERSRALERLALVSNELFFKF